MQKPHQRISRLYEWTPEIGEILKILLEPENVKDRFAKVVEKEVQIVGHLNKWNPGCFRKTIFYFLHANHGNTCRVYSRKIIWAAVTKLLFFYLNNVVLVLKDQGLSVRLSTKLRLSDCKSCQNINLSSVSYMSCLQTSLVYHKSIYTKYLFAFTFFSPGSPNLGGQIRCAQNRYRAWYAKLKFEGKGSV